MGRAQVAFLNILGTAPQLPYPAIRLQGPSPHTEFQLALPPWRQLLSPGASAQRSPRRMPAARHHRSSRADQSARRPSNTPLVAERCTPAACLSLVRRSPSHAGGCARGPCEPYEARRLAPACPLLGQIEHAEDFARAMCHKRLMHRSKHVHRIAMPYSITSSARCWRCKGTSRPSALAVLRLITSSNLTGAWTGSSLGFAPLRMRSA